jgi:hypothetical protein
LNDGIEIRNLTAAQVHQVVGWAQAEGWNPATFDAACFYAADPAGFFGTFLNGELAAAISVVRYGDEYAFLGLYICRPELRGRGLGLRVWNAGLAHAEGRTIGLDGVPAQQSNYVKSGFQLAWRNHRFQGMGGGARRPGVVDLDTVPFQQVAGYDKAVFEADRGRFLRVWIAQPEAIRLGVERDGMLKGWGMLRPTSDGNKVGPLFADDESTADLLLDGLLASVPGETVFLDVPEPNALAMRMAEGHGMTPTFETARMYRGPARSIAIGKVWGITSFELG